MGVMARQAMPFRNASTLTVFYALGYPIGSRYTRHDQLVAYFKIDNLFDRDPEPAPQANPSFAINPALYDVVGRTYRAGLRYSY